MSNIRPVQDNVVVELDDIPADSDLIAIFHSKESGNTEPVLATVLAVGPGYYPEVKLDKSNPENWYKGDYIGPVKYGKFVETTLKPGDRVLVMDKQVGERVHPKHIPEGAKHGSVRIVREFSDEVLAVVGP